ncbi:MAG: phosphopantetheine-binding protein [Caulobacterales bacterium]
MASPHEAELLDIIAAEALIERDTLALDAQLDALGIDSVDFVSIVFALEEKYNISVEDGEIARDKTLGDMITLLESKIAAAGAA